MLRTILALLLFAVPASAGVHYEAETKTVVLYGVTTSVQWVQLNELIASQEVRQVRMQGPGGHLYAGLAIGRLIHHHQLTVTIPEGTQCASACAFAALGSPKVYVDGKMLIHRGYFQQMPTMSTLDEFARRSGEGYLDTTRYLLEMGYTIGLAKAIVSGSSPCIFLDMGGKEFIDQLRNPDPLSIKPNLSMGKVNKCNG